MDSRIFGKELTNLMGPDHRDKATYSYIHLEKAKDHSLNLDKPHHHKPHNHSLSLKDESSSPPALDYNNPQLVPEYLMDSLKFLRRQEKETHKALKQPNPNATVSQNQRAKLIDWLVKLHYKYKMFPQTLFTIVALIDQYVRTKQTTLSELQLVGVAALYIAAKFEETYQVPPMKQLVACCAFQYSSTEILNKQADIIKQLNFNLIVNSTYKFFSIFHTLIGLQPKNQHLAQYILELALLQSKFLQYSPSLMAASAIYLIKKIRKTQAVWSSWMGEIVNYEEKQLKNCAKELCSLLESAGEMEHAKSIKEKFSQACFHEVTKIKLERKEKKQK